MPGGEYLQHVDQGVGLFRVELLADEGKTVPTRLHMLPDGPMLHTRDGRHFGLESPLAAMAASELPILVDVDHAADFGMGTEASGWIRSLEHVTLESSDGRAPGIWGVVDWTADGAKLVERVDGMEPKYKFTSSVVKADHETNEIQSLLGLSLTNKPAMPVQEIAAFSAQLSKTRPSAEETETMKAEEIKTLRATFGLADDASSADILAAVASSRTEHATLSASVQALTAEAAAHGSRADKAEADLASHTAAAFTASVEAALDSATTDGKVTPATRGQWQAFCLEGPERLEFFEKTILPGLQSVADDAAPAPGGGKRTSAFGIDPQVEANLRAQGMTDEDITETLTFMADQAAAKSAQKED